MIFKLGIILAIALATAVLALLLLWSARRHRSPRLDIGCAEGIESLSRSLAGLTLGTLVEGNAIEIVLNEHFFDAVEEQMNAARHSIHLENFLWKEGRVSARMSEALCRASTRGVRVRVLLDAMGGRRMSAATRRRLRESGCQLAFFHRWGLTNLGVITDRDHRKLVIVDGSSAFVGGHCYTDAWLGDHNASNEQTAYDVSVHVTGPIVHALQSAFSENWTAETGKLFAGDHVFPKLKSQGDIPMHAAFAKPERSAPAVKILHHAVICIARHRIWIQNPYFIPKPEAIEALGAAVRRGVDVRVLIPAISVTDNPIVNLASRRNYGKLMRCGLKLYEYQKGLLHQKVMTVDGAWSAVGSSNFDDRSFDTNDELTLGILDGQTTEKLDRLFCELLRDAKPVSLNTWEKRPLHRHLQEHACYLVRQVL